MKGFVAIRSWIVERWRRLNRMVVSNFPAAYAVYLHQALLLWVLVAPVLAAVLFALPITKSGPLLPIAGIVWAFYVAAFVVILIYVYFTARRVATFADSPMSPFRTAGGALLVCVLIGATPGLAHQVLYQRFDAAVHYSDKRLCRDIKVLRDITRDCTAGKEYRDADGPGRRNNEEIALFASCRAGKPRGFPGSRLQRAVEMCKAYGVCAADREMPPEYFASHEVSQEACRFLEEEMVNYDPRINWSKTYVYGKEFTAHMHAVQVLAARGPWSFRLLDYGLFICATILSALILAIQSLNPRVWLRSALVVVVGTGLMFLADIAMDGAYPLMTLEPNPMVYAVIAGYLLALIIVCLAYRWRWWQGPGMYAGALALMTSPIAATLGAWLLLGWRGNFIRDGFTAIFLSIGDYVPLGGRLHQYDGLNLYLPQVVGIIGIILYGLSLALYAPLVTRVRLEPRD